MFRLKYYQERCLETLRDFLADARTSPVDEAFSVHAVPAGNTLPSYRHYNFGEVPYVCMRLPTGGGKTVLASHAVRVATQHYLDFDFPVVLWLVPTRTIRDQTLDALNKPDHPYRAELDRWFGQKVRVLGIDDFPQLRPHDLGQQCVVVLATLANLRVSDTSGRRVYAHNEHLEPHFKDVDFGNTTLETVSENDLHEYGIGREALGQVKYSFANLLALQRPLIIMDEAHNARTSLTFETVKRVNPSAVIELTATPDTSNTSSSNVLTHVSASELKAENMIKLPIMLTEHGTWEAAVRDSVLAREQLAISAQKEADYIRPIVLFQAERKDGNVTWQRLRNHLIDELHVSQERIAVVTGTQRELDAINLLSRDCPIDYIITVEALKEGWDCSFAYIFCSVREVRSSKDAEQLLGRVLRMPYATRRQQTTLNHAYAHLCSATFSTAAKELTDKLVHMGFEALEVPSNVRPGTQSGLFDDDGDHRTPQDTQPNLRIPLPTFVDLPDDLDGETAGTAVAYVDDDSCEFRASGLVSNDAAKAVARAFKGKQKKDVLAQIEQHNARIQALRTPSESGTEFAPVPQLGLRRQGEFDLLEPESYLFENGSWSPLDFSIDLSNFSVRETEHTFVVDINGWKVQYSMADQNPAEELNLLEGVFDDQDIIGWLDRNVHTPDIRRPELLKYLTQLVGHLKKERGLTLTALARSKFLLARAVRDKLAELRQSAAQRGFQQLIFIDNESLSTSSDLAYLFQAERYPARPPYYTGRYTFGKHFFPVLEDLREGSEEFYCAQAIDSHPAVKHWIRNLVNRSAASFRLPLAGRWFYPDFVAELHDGRIFVVEYKGEVYRTNDDSREKDAVGRLWAERSAGTCLFLMAVERDNDGKNISQQIDSVINT